MVKKPVKLGAMVLLGTVLFVYSPAVAYAYSPYVTTGSATAITSSTAILNGSVNADNMPTSVWFEYSTDSGLRGSLSATAYRFTSGNSGNIVANIGGLYPNTIYYFRAVAQNMDGRTYGNIYLFTTQYSYPVVNNVYVSNNPAQPFSAITEPVSNLGSTSVQLHALVYNDTSASSNTWFEWGTNGNLGNRTTMTQTGVLPAVKRADRLTGLSPGTTYYFRAMAENALTRSNGNVLSFTTSGAKAVAAVSEAPSTTKTNSAPTTPAEKEKVSSLSANVFASGSFFPESILGWSVLIILLLILIILAKHLYLDFAVKKSPPDSGHS
ncbi:MAG: hypothetical protein AAB933_03695 [Patescibacteria group bacterium]